MIKNLRVKLISIMFIIYVALFIIDLRFTLQNMEQEGNPICLYFISLIGFPLNLLISYACICIPLSFGRIWKKINENYKVFLLFYIVLFVFTIGHLRGVISWL
jgi:hypothetical protein